MRAFLDAHISLHQLHTWMSMSCIWHIRLSYVPYLANLFECVLQADRDLHLQDDKGTIDCSCQEGLYTPITTSEIVPGHCQTGLPRLRKQREIFALAKASYLHLGGGNQCLSTACLRERTTILLSLLRPRGFPIAIRVKIVCILTWKFRLQHSKLKLSHNGKNDPKETCEQAST